MATAGIDLRRVGRERHAVVVIDGFADDPDALRAAAAAQPFGPAHHAYPGIRADLPPDYWPRQAARVEEAIAAILGHRCHHHVIDGSYSIVTTPRDRLTVSQRLPHCDAHGADRVALVHFLAAADDEGGTAFFRHRSTGFESVDDERAPIYREQLDAELRHGGLPPAAYIAGDDRLFECIAAVPARYNRAILYRSFALHSGIIPPTASLSADPAAGRLTITGFLATG